MRRLLYVPTIHSEADLGSVGPALTQTSTALLGTLRWRLHNETVGKFWESVQAYLWSYAPSIVKVYQDGLAADGELGRRIVEEAAARGSPNYQLVRDLLNRGAELRKTEDPVLLLREHENMRRCVQQEPPGAGPPNAQLYPVQRDRLLQQRDRFIADTINATLKEGELGVLFIGAYHKLAPRLMGDIAVDYVKEPGQVQAYFEELLFGHDARTLEELSQYLTRPVTRQL